MLIFAHPPGYAMHDDANGNCRHCCASQLKVGFVQAAVDINNLTDSER